MGVVTMSELKPSISGKRSFRPSSSTRHVTEWPISDVSSDLTVDVGATSFALHKFPLVSKSGRIRKMLMEVKDSKVLRLNLHNVPGGSEAFELAAKFSYGINIEINLSNVAKLHCTSHFLEMTEEYADKNLETRTETFLKENVLPNITNSISVLHCCENLLPVAEEISLVTRLITSIANNACKEQLTCGLSKLESNYTKPVLHSDEDDWWGKKLTVLNLEFFQRVLTAVKTKGLKQDMIAKILMNYAHNSLQGLFLRDPQLESQKKHRVIVEVVVSLLPTQSRKSTVPMAFLSSLLKSSIMASTSTACRSDLERRIGLQLDQAILEDILIPANAHGLKQDMIAKILMNYAHNSLQGLFLRDPQLESQKKHRVIVEVVVSLLPTQSRKSTVPMAFLSSLLKSSIMASTSTACRSDLERRIGLQLDQAILEDILIPANAHELLPDHARLVNDGLYRAVDIFLKVHPNLKDSERYRMCKTIDCQKLSQEACSHAAQNERLPVQMAVQVLYFEQIRLRNAMNGGHNHLFFGSLNTQFPQRSASAAGSGCISPRDNYASVRRENRELKLEVTRMRMRLTDLEKDHVSMKQELVKTHPANKLFKSLTKKLAKLNTLFRFKDVRGIGSRPSSESRFMFQKRRRNSIA
ncbi:BTB/POZ domain-containing protein [Artemisia annua]|uniref:BTB/POZ domain-containing protein n=1 Tax=Artemisia annua TaxID=35608 RepID=A0A2U1NML3_ARTAN|nr:BTB/POZ domain-containing protein [Artemisia annua]